MFQITETTEATLAAVTNRTEAFERDHPDAGDVDTLAAGEDHEGEDEQLQGEGPGDDLDDDDSWHADIASGEASKAALDATGQNPFSCSEATETPDREVAADAEEMKPRRGRRSAADATEGADDDKGRVPGAGDPLHRSMRRHGRRPV